MRKSFFALIVVSLLTLTSCSTIMNNLPGVYTLDIQQGNIINQEMIDQLRPKMTKRQVLYIMGSSMLVDVFHQKRWDYLYSEQPGGELRKQKRLSLFFEGEELIGVQGDFKPSSSPVVKKSNETTVEVPERDLDKTLWEKITGLFSDDTKKITNSKKKDPETDDTTTKPVEKPEKSMWEKITSPFRDDESETVIKQTEEKVMDLENDSQ